VTVENALSQLATDPVTVTVLVDDVSPHVLTVSGIPDLSSRANLLDPPEALPVVQRIAPIDLGRFWRYYDPWPGVDLPLDAIDWTSPAYDDAHWGEGLPAFVYDQTLEVLPVPTGEALSGGMPTAYFRTWFDHLAGSRSRGLFGVSRRSHGC